MRRAQRGSGEGARRRRAERRARRWRREAEPRWSRTCCSSPHTNIRRAPATRTPRGARRGGPTHARACASNVPHLKKLSGVHRASHTALSLCIDLAGKGHFANCPSKRIKSAMQVGFELDGATVNARRWHFVVLFLIRAEPAHRSRPHSFSVSLTLTQPTSYRQPTEAEEIECAAIEGRQSNATAAAAPTTAKGQGVFSLLSQSCSQAEVARSERDLDLRLWRRESSQQG